MSKVKIYTTPYCGFCHRAKRLLESRKIEFEEIDVSDPGTKNEVMQKYHWDTVPIIIIDGQVIGGCTELMQLDAQGKLHI